MNYIKTYLIACALIGGTFFIHGAEIDPKILAESRRLEEQRQEQEALAESRILEESRRSAQRKSPVAQELSEEEQLALALSASQAEADEIARQKKALQKIEQERKDREHKRRDQTEQERNRRTQEEHDRLVAQQAQEEFDRQAAEEIAERDRKRQQEDADHKAAQRLAEEDRTREQERKAAEDKKQREAAERKREAESPITGFNTITYKVHPQLGASCGLHAIDNGNKAYTFLIKNESPAEILTQPLSAATGAVTERDMLDQTQIDHIARHILKMNDRCYTILPNFMQSKDEFLQPLPQKTDVTYVPDTLGTAIEALRTQARATHVFVIANAKIERNEKEELVGHDDHWIAIVADKKDGIVTFHYMDTGGGPNTDYTKALEEIITRGNYHGMQLAIMLETINLTTIARAINSGAYGTALEYLKDRVDRAHQGNLVNHPRFPRDDIRRLLEHIAFAAGEPYATQAQELLNKLR